MDGGKDLHNPTDPEEAGVLGTGSAGPRGWMSLSKGSLAEAGGPATRPRRSGSGWMDV